MSPMCRCAYLFCHCVYGIVCIVDLLLNAPVLHLINIWYKDYVCVPLFLEDIF